MSIYIDDNYSIDSQHIISILDYQLITSSEKMRQYIDTLHSKGKVQGEELDAKSMIITDDTVYFSPFSTYSLKKRLNKQSIITKLDELTPL